MKKLLSSLAISLVGLLALGCSESKHTSNGVAQVSTVSVVFVDTLSESDKEQIRLSVLAAFKALLEDYPELGGTVITYNINIVNSTVEITVKGNKFLVFCGQDNECPNLYEAFCLKRFGPNHPDHSKWKNRCKQIEDDCKKRNRKH